MFVGDDLSEVIVSSRFWLKLYPCHKTIKNYKSGSLKKNKENRVKVCSEVIGQWWENGDQLVSRPDRCHPRGLSLRPGGKAEGAGKKLS